MTREQHLNFCKKCINRKLDMKVGLVCNLTGEIANFKDECKSFEMDNTVVENIDNNEAVEHTDVLHKLSDRNIEKFQSDQDYSKAIMGGIGVGLIGALLWGIITVMSGYQIGYMAIAIGASVGLTIRSLGKGIDPIFGITGGVIALLSCLLGNILSIIGFMADQSGMGYIETLSVFDFNQLIPIMTETFDVMDIVFYGIAAFQAYKLSFRKFTEKDLHELD